MSTTFLVTQGDVTINRANGQARLIADDDKIRQDLRIALSTGARQDNVGAGLEDVISGQAATPSFVENAILRRVRNMVEAIQRLQQQFQRNQRPRGERLIRAATIQVSTVANDPTAYYFRAEFITGRNPSDPIRLSGRLS